MLLNDMIISVKIHFSVNSRYPFQLFRRYESSVITLINVLEGPSL